jgi:hypothetical protein
VDVGKGVSTAVGALVGDVGEAVGVSEGHIAQKCGHPARTLEFEHPTNSTRTPHSAGSGTLHAVVGDTVGVCVGALDGEVVGDAVGDAVGRDVGDIEGADVGEWVGLVGVAVGASVHCPHNCGQTRATSELEHPMISTVAVHSAGSGPA